MWHTAMSSKILGAATYRPRWGRGRKIWLGLLFLATSCNGSQALSLGLPDFFSLLDDVSSLTGGLPLPPQQPGTSWLHRHRCFTLQCGFYTCSSAEGFDSWGILGLCVGPCHQQGREGGGRGSSALWLASKLV